jgi:hypothetical protein
MLTFVKNIMLPAAKVRGNSRRLMALTGLGAAVSGFRFVTPDDTPALIFRYLCLAMGGVALFWLTLLICFPPRGR